MWREFFLQLRKAGAIFRYCASMASVLHWNAYILTCYLMREIWGTDHEKLHRYSLRHFAWDRISSNAFNTIEAPHQKSRIALALGNWRCTITSSSPSLPLSLIALTLMTTSSVPVTPATAFILFKKAWMMVCYCHKATTIKRTHVLHNSRDQDSRLFLKIKSSKLLK